MQRILVIGISGAGKTTLARELAQRLGCPRIELDELFWGPGWRQKPPHEFRALVRAATEGEAWVADGNYASARDLLWPRATAVVWLNYSLPRVMLQLARRTLRRLWHREQLWHGNREDWRRTFCSRESILWWALSMHGPKRREFEALRARGEFPHLEWHELRSPADLRRLLASGDVPEPELHTR